MSEIAVCVGLLVGGRSSRMGRDKALIEFSGAPMAAHVAAALSAHSRERFLLGVSPGPRLDSLSRVMPGAPWNFLPDATGLAGPMAGILAGLRARPDARWLIAACDQPHLTRDALRWLLDAAEAAEARALFVRDEAAHIQPLPGVFGPDLLPFAESLVVSGRRAPRELAAVPGAHILPIPHAHRAGWTSVDTPHDLASLGG